MHVHQNDFSFQCMKEHGVWKFVFSSSATVYGMPQTLPISEQHPVGTGITNPYGKSKFFIEEIIKDLCKTEKVLASSCASTKDYWQFIYSYCRTWSAEHFLLFADV